MRRRYIVASLLVVLLVVVLAAAGCGGTETTTTTAAPSSSTTAAPSTETTAAPSTETTAAPSTETTAAAGPATGEPIKIGLSNSLTGSGAAPGASFGNGVELQVEYVNQNGGINGRPLQLVAYDDKSDVPSMIANVNKLVQQDKVFATIGPFAQYMQEPARQIAEQNKVPMVGPGPATIQQLDAKPQYQWSIMTAAGPRVQGASVVKVVTAHGWKNILGLADSLTIDQETLDVLAELAPAAGFKFTKMPDTFGLDQQDFQPILNKMMDQINTVKPDAIILYVNPLAFPPLYKGLRGLGVQLPILAGTACAHPAIFAQGPQAVEGAYVMDSGGNVNPTALPDSWPVKNLQVDFAQRYQAKYNTPPDFFAADGADLVTVLAAGMRQAGAVDQAKVAQALLNLKELPTLEGLMTWTPEATSEGVHGFMVEWQVKNAQWVLVTTIEQP